MTTKAEWLALAERCEKATGPDREIDWCIHAAILNWPAEIKPRQAGDAEYTASLDAITALIEREFPGRSYRSGRCEDGTYWAAIEFPFVVKAASEPLARCVFFCRAMAEKAA